MVGLREYLQGDCYAANTLDSNFWRAEMPMKYARLTEPLVRDDGVLRTATWDEALDRAASGFRAAVEAHGPDTYGMLSCSKATNEVNFIAQKFTRVAIGTNNIDSCNRT
jgi:formate dehydrogenase (hydrogenase)